MKEDEGGREGGEGGCEAGSEAGSVHTTGLKSAEKANIFKQFETALVDQYTLNGSRSFC